MQLRLILGLVAGLGIWVTGCSGSRTGDRPSNPGTDAGNTGGTSGGGGRVAGGAGSGGIGGGDSGADAGNTGGTGTGGTGTGGTAAGGNGTGGNGTGGSGTGGSGTGGSGGSLSCAATGTAYCTQLNGWDEVCNANGTAYLCPGQTPKCYKLTTGDLTCVLSDSEPCDWATYQAHCSGNTTWTCQNLDNAGAVTWSADCGTAPDCLNPDTYAYDVPGPCECAQKKDGTPVCVQPAVQGCDPSSAPRTCDGNVLHYCDAAGLTAVHDCGPNMVCHAANGTAGCVVSPLTACSGRAPSCFNDTLQQLCCGPDIPTCLPGYLTLQDCRAVSGPDSVCDAAYGDCTP